MEKNNNLTLIILLLIVFVIGFLGGSLWTENKTLKSANNPKAEVVNLEEKSNPLEKIPAITDDDHVRGNKDAKVVFIEYSDYECPYCNKFHPSMLQIMENYGDQIAWVYRHFPLNFHAHAQILAETSECIAEYTDNDAFWNFSDAVYTGMADKSIYDADGKNITNNTIMNLAVKAGANENQIQDCLDKNEMTSKVNDQASIGGQAGITGTPGTVVISEKGGFELIPGALPYAQIEKILEKHL